MELKEGDRCWIIYDEMDEKFALECIYIGRDGVGKLALKDIVHGHIVVRDHNGICWSELEAYKMLARIYKNSADAENSNNKILHDKIHSFEMDLADIKGSLIKIKHSILGWILN